MRLARPAPRRPRDSATALACTLAACALASACSDAKVSGAQPGATGGAPGSGAGGSRGGSGAAPGGLDGPSFEIGRAEAPPATDTPPGTGPVCAEQSLKAERTPVDLLLLIDASDSM